jgi:micrococcal nuclease
VDEKLLLKLAWMGTITGLLCLYFVTEHYYLYPTLDGPYNVTYVIDGDTLDIGTGERIRLSGINTPESGECFYQEAKNALHNLTYGKQVHLEQDIDTRGKYGRKLAYIYMGKKMVNEQLVSQGLAKVYDKYNSTTKRYEQLKEIENVAKGKQLGVWSCTDPKEGCIYVASKNSNIYHEPHCKWAKKIKAENVVCFHSLEETKGYEPAKSC